MDSIKCLLWPRAPQNYVFTGIYTQLQSRQRSQLLFPSRLIRFEVQYLVLFSILEGSCLFLFLFKRSYEAVLHFD